MTVPIVRVATEFVCSILVRILFDVCRDTHMNDAVRISHHTVWAGTALDLIDEFHSLNDLAPDRILAIQLGIRREHDEELAVGAVRTAAARHAADAAEELPLRSELGLQIRQLAATSTGSGR